MPIGIRNVVRDITGITDQNDVPNAVIDEALQSGRGELYAATFKTDWDTDTSHPLYYKAQDLVHYVAAVRILDRYAGQQDKANLLNERIKQMSMELTTQMNSYNMIQSAANPAASKFSVVASAYKSWPLNEKADQVKSKIIIPGD